MSDYDWRELPQLKGKYVESVFNQLGNNFPISEASDHFITTIERFWFLKIDEEIAIDMLIHGHSWSLKQLIRVSQELDN